MLCALFWPAHALAHGLNAGYDGLPAGMTAGVAIACAVTCGVAWAHTRNALFAAGMIFAGHVCQGLGLLAWGVAIIGAIDNLARPFLMKGGTRLHPPVIFLAVIGGVTAFGVVGLLVGPLAAALFLTALRIYDRDYRARLLADVTPAGSSRGRDDSAAGAPR